MLFNSVDFLFFLPITLIGFFLLSKLHNELLSRLWLIFASLFFYSWWEFQYLFLIIISMLFNYTLGSALSRSPRKNYIISGILMNLILLGYYKYSNFFVDNFNLITSNHYHLEKVILPLAISFFTFQQIAYLVDSYRGQIKEYNFFNYCLFITFFPQLIAGPIVHHKEMLPQFSNRECRLLKVENISVGLTIFMIGMFKKVVIADNIATFSTPVFNATQAGVAVPFFEAWLAAFCYSFQLYFDFSGYSDMAIGAARMFGIKLPLNFHSPYKAKNIIEFWRRWHITLSRFMKDYVYIPLGGSHTGSARKYTHIIITMLLAGLWHGAGWNFIIWGALHSIYLVINHFWRWLRLSFAQGLKKQNALANISSMLLTFLAVVIAWVFFRAETLDGALQMLNAMMAIGGEGEEILGRASVLKGFCAVFLLCAIVWLSPNTQQIMANYNPTISSFETFSHRLFLWRPNKCNAIIAAIITIYTLITMLLSRQSEFLYFQF